MGNYLNVGNAGFEAMIKDIYVDKTGMIKYINRTLGTTRKLTCFSRPRRFGKSFAAKMLCAYYDKSCDSRKLFQGLAISKDVSFEKYLNKFDVIYLDITWFISSVEDIKNTVCILQEKVIKELREAYPDARQEHTLPETLAAISEITRSKFIVIIDEWDALFREVKDDRDLQDEYIMLLRGLFKNSGLTDKIIEAAYMTGILPIKKYGNQSAVSDFIEYNMLEPEPLEEYVGFTEEEVRALCAGSRLGFEDIQKWYDGYVLGDNIHVYNPKSVIEAVNRNRIRNYWTRTETYESLKVYIDLDEDGLKDAIIQMLSGKHVKIKVGSFQNDMTNIKSKDDVLTLLVHLGYLAYDSGEEAVFIPNEEVRQEFVLAVTTGKHKELAELIRNSDRLLEQTLKMNEEAVAAAVEEAHKAVSSPISYNNEESLRSTIRLAYLTCIDEFMWFQELPSGKGYADLAFVPKKGSSMPVILIELKWNKSDEGAIKQIKNRDYPYVLKDYGSDILLVGINYDEKSKKHTCKIEKYKKENMS